MIKDENLTTSQRAEKELERRLAAARGEVGIDTGMIFAQHVLREETGWFGDYQTEYDFNHKTRDVLLAHGRRDAAHATWAASIIRHNVSSLIRSSNLFAVLHLMQLAVSTYILYLIW